MYKIAVLGNYNSIYGFAALGLDTFPVEDPADGKEKLNRLAAGEYAVIYITEQLAAQLSAEISKYSEELMPAIIQIPGISGNTGAGIENVNPWRRQLAPIFFSVMSDKKAGDWFR